MAKRKRKVPIICGRRVVDLQGPAGGSRGRLPHCVLIGKSPRAREAVRQSLQLRLGGRRQMDQVGSRPDIRRLQAGSVELFAIEAAIFPCVPDHGA